MSTTPTENLATGGTGHRTRLVVYRVLATLAGLFFLVAVVLAVPAPWVILDLGRIPTPSRTAGSSRSPAVWTPSRWSCS
jgi:hypothetical protein